MERRSYHLWASLAILLLSIGPPSAVHAAELDAPTLAEGGGAGQGWASMRATSVDGAAFEFEVGQLESGGFNQVAGFVYDGDGAFLGGLTITGSGGDDRVVVRAQAAPGVSVDEGVVITDWPRGDGGSVIRFTVDPPDDPGQEPVTRQAIVYVAGDLGGWYWTVRGEHGATVDATLEGEASYFIGAEDFGGGASVRAVQVPVSARATASSSVTLEIEHAFIGGFRSSTMSADVLRLDGPEGSRDCPCSFLDPTSAPGTYTFTEVAGAGAGLKGLDAAYVGGADARLPPASP